MVSKHLSGNAQYQNGRKGRHRAQKVEIIAWLTHKLTKKDMMFMDLRSMAENKQWKPFGVLITRVWANEHGREDKTCDLLMNSHHCIDVWNKVKDIQAGGSGNVCNKLTDIQAGGSDNVCNKNKDVGAGSEGNQPDSISQKVAIKKDIKEEDVTEEFSTSAILACSVCGDICHRAILTRCCEASACRACAIKKITSARSCWVVECLREGVATKDLDNDEVMRKAVDQYKNKGQVDPGLLEELRGRREKKGKGSIEIVKNSVTVKEEKIKEEETLVNKEEETMDNKEEETFVNKSKRTPKNIGPYACLQSNCTEYFETWGDARRHMKEAHGLVSNLSNKVKKSRFKAKKLQIKGATVVN